MLNIRRPRAAAALVALGAFTFIPRPAFAGPYTKMAPDVATYVQSLGFKPPSQPTATLDAISPQLRAQLEAYLLEGAEAAALKGDPVLLAWNAGTASGLAPWSYADCGAVDYSVTFDCPWSTAWNVGFNVDVVASVGLVDAAVKATHPGETPQAVGQSVLALASQTVVFPNVDPAVIALDPAKTTAGMQNAYWLATLMRDMRVGAYIQVVPATAWPCYQAAYPAWCADYRVPAIWQTESDLLSQTINSWNEIEAEWAKALAPDVIVDDVSSGFTIDGTVVNGKLGGWRGHYTSAPAAAAVMHTGKWKTPLPAGKWHVSMFLPFAPDASAPDAIVTVHATDGDHDVNLDRTPMSGGFVALGDFEFDGGDATVTMTDKATKGSVAWDAVRFHALSLGVSPTGSTSAGTGIGTGTGTGSGTGGGTGTGTGGATGAAGGGGAGATTGAGGAGGGGSKSTHGTTAGKGCSCRLASDRSDDAPWALGLLAALAVARRRR